MTETLRQKQSRFVRMVGDLIEYATGQGYDLTFGEAYRTPEQAALNAKKGSGISNSLHTKRLAIDLNLYKDGVWLKDSTDHAELGAWWKKRGGSWGGDFKKNPDGNHYSLEHEGVR